jgi:uncharacterized Zn finger protein (UPF0148 family)
MHAEAECPHCGLPLSRPATNGATIRRECGPSEESQRIQELTREVRLLQATIAALRGSRTPFVQH